MYLKAFNTIGIPTLTVFIVFILVSSFGLHSIQIPHNHFGQDHHQTDTKQSAPEFTILMHAVDKKLFVMIASIWSLGVLVSPLLNVGWSVFVSLVNLFYRILWRLIREKPLVIDNYLNVFLAQGIQNPKLY